MSKTDFAIGTTNFALAFFGLVVVCWIAFIEIIAPALDRLDEWSQA